MRDFHTRLYHRLNWRIMSWIIVIYMMDSIDRTNLGYARAHLSHDIGLTAAQFGFAAGIFFVGLVLFEIPVSLLSLRIGAPKTFARIMILWGLTSAATGFIHNKEEFYILRFLLGVFEAGFAPTCTCYLARWYPENRMSAVIFWHQLSLPLAGVILGPTSGWILSHLDQVGGVAGWRWMFLVEALPSVLLGLVAAFVLPATPADAKWLTPPERAAIAAWTPRANVRHTRFADVLRDPLSYLLSIGFFALISGMYMINFWLPSIIREAGATSPMAVGLYAALPYAVSVASMAWWSHRSDKAGERAFHCYAPAFVAGACLVLSVALPDIFALRLLMLALATAGIYAAYVVFWAFAANIFEGSAAPGGFALINAIGLWGGMVSPVIVGRLTTATGTISAGVGCLGVIVIAGGFVLRHATRVVVAQMQAETPAQPPALAIPSRQ
jgi:MFS family permease